MPARCATVLAVAACVYDQSGHSEADLDFLYAINAAGKEWIDQLNAANINFGAGNFGRARYALRRCGIEPGAGMFGNDEYL